MQQFDLLRGRFNIAAFFAICQLLSVGASCADQIILRNLTIISDRTVVSFDADGVRLDNGTVIGWDQIEQGAVGPERQADFDKQLQNFGRRLHLVRQRLDVEDFRDLLPQLTELYPIYRGRRSQTAYMVVQAKMWAHLARGEREEALEPYLRCFELLRNSEKAADSIPGARRLKFDRATGLSAELTPIWFDADRAAQQLDSVRAAVRRMSGPRPVGAYIYFSTLALAAGELAEADRFSSAIPANNDELAEWKLILAAQAEITGQRAGDGISNLRARVMEFAPSRQPLGLYWLGISELSASDQASQQSGLLRLLRIPALHGKRTPEVAGAALYRVAVELNNMNDSRGSVAVRNELLDRFGQTHFAGLARAPENTP